MTRKPGGVGHFPPLGLVLHHLEHLPSLALTFDEMPSLGTKAENSDVPSNIPIIWPSSRDQDNATRAKRHLYPHSFLCELACPTSSAWAKPLLGKIFLLVVHLPLPKRFGQR